MFAHHYLCGSSGDVSACSISLTTVFLNELCAIIFTSPATYSHIAEFKRYRSVKRVNLRGTVKYVIVAYAIVRAAVSHSSAESNYVSTDNTALCVCEIEKTVKTTDNEGLGSLRVKQGRDSILIKSVNKSTMFHFSPITVVKEGERGGGICMPVYARGS